MGTTHEIDPHNLRILNHNERRVWKSLNKGEASMKVDLLQRIEAMDVDETLIKDKEGNPPTLKEVAVRALRAPHNSDQTTNLKQKTERYALIKRLVASDEIELTERECSLIMDRAGMIYLQVELIGRLGDILTPPKNVVAKPEAAKPEEVPAN